MAFEAESSAAVPDDGRVIASSLDISVPGAFFGIILMMAITASICFSMTQIALFGVCFADCAVLFLPFFLIVRHLRLMAVETEFGLLVT